MPKTSIRQAMLSRRKLLADEDCRCASMRIQQSLLSWVSYQRASCIIAYVPIRNEVDTSLLVQHALDSGKRVALPAVVGRNMVFREVQSGYELQRGAFGVYEPPDDARLFDPKEADLVVVPGVAFDLQGHRIGYGKGYYDKTVHILEGQGRLVGFCYDFQLVEAIAGQVHDVKMDWVITELRVIASS